MPTSYGSAVGTCFMHHVAFASRLESDVHRDRGCIRCGGGTEAALAHISRVTHFLKSL